MKFVARLLFSMAVFMGFSSISYAYIDVYPRMVDFGNVRAQTSRSVTITFTNNSITPLRSFNVYCSGSLSVFMCSSSCFQLPAWGSCRVQVEFRPRSGDGQMHWINVEGRGSGEYVSASVRGIDSAENYAEKREKKYFWLATAASLFRTTGFDRQIPGSIYP